MHAREVHSNSQPTMLELRMRNEIQVCRISGVTILRVIWVVWGGGINTVKFELLKFLIRVVVSVQ